MNLLKNIYQVPALLGRRPASRLPRRRCPLSVHAALHDVQRRAQVREEDTECPGRGGRTRVAFLREKALLKGHGKGGETTVFAFIIANFISTVCTHLSWA